jgi:hypothetical protein
MTPLEERLPLEWRPITGFPDYEVREDGVIRRGVPDKKGRFLGKIIKPKTYSKYGHLHVCLCVNGTKKFICIHQAVIRAFVGTPPTPKHEVAHGDGVPSNNHWRNLRWATRRENALDQIAHGTNVAGDRNGRAALCWDQVRDIRRESSAGETATRLAKKYGVGLSTISRITRSECWIEEVKC